VCVLVLTQPPSASPAPFLCVLYVRRFVFVSSLGEPGDVALLCCCVFVCACPCHQVLRRCVFATQAPDQRPSVTLDRFLAMRRPSRNIFRQLMRQVRRARVRARAPGSRLGRGWLRSLSFFVCL
jgi:hypothetical protein